MSRHVLVWILGMFNDITPLQTKREWWSCEVFDFLWNLCSWHVLGIRKSHLTNLVEWHWISFYEVTWSVWFFFFFWHLGSSAHVGHKKISLDKLNPMTLIIFLTTYRITCFKRYLFLFLMRSHSLFSPSHPIVTNKNVDPFWCLGC